MACHFVQALAKALHEEPQDITEGAVTPFVEIFEDVQSHSAGRIPQLLLHISLMVSSFQEQGSPGGPQSRQSS